MAKLTRHELVQDGVDCTVNVVEDAREIVEGDETGRVIQWWRTGQVHGPDALRVVRRPANEEGHDDGHYCTGNKKSN